MVEVGQEAPGFPLKDQNGRDAASANLAMPRALAEYESALAEIS